MPRYEPSASYLSRLSFLILTQRNITQLKPALGHAACCRLSTADRLDKLLKRNGEKRTPADLQKLRGDTSCCACVLWLSCYFLLEFLYVVIIFVTLFPNDHILNWFIL